MRIGNIFTAGVALSAGLASGQNCSPPLCPKVFRGNQIEDYVLNEKSPTCTPSFPEICRDQYGIVYSEINQATNNFKESEKQEESPSKSDLEELGASFVYLQLLGLVFPNLIH